MNPAIPYFLQLFVSQIRMEEKLRDQELTPEQIQDVYTRRIIGPTCRAYFDHYSQRLRRYGRTGEHAALAILNEIAHMPTGRASSSALYDVYRTVRKKGASDFEFDEIMADLESDWYVTLNPKTSEYSFLLSVMKDWWGRFHRASSKRTK